MKTLEKHGLHGWVAAENQVLEDYASSCLQACDDEHFPNFKKIEAYRPILEGGPKLLFDTYWTHIQEHNNVNLFLDNLEKFRINDSVGNPDTYSDNRIGEFSPSTLKYSFNAIDILEFIKDHGDLNKIKNIVEIGGGYGGLCLILSGFVEWDTYTLIDLPESCKLVEKYVSQFPNLEGKVKTLSCNKVTKKSFNKIDLAIAINSLSECDRDTQLDYFSKVISKSAFSYIVRNPDNQERLNDHIATIDSLGDEFLVDDSGRVEQTYSNQIIVYIKKDDQPA